MSEKEDIELPVPYKVYDSEVEYDMKIDDAYNCLLRNMAGLSKITRQQFDEAYITFHSMMWNKFEWLDSCIYTAMVETDSYMGIEYAVYRKFDRGKLATALCSIFPSANCLDWRRRPDKKYSNKEQIEHVIYLESLLNCYIDETKKDYEKSPKYRYDKKKDIEYANKILNIFYLIKKQLKEGKNENK